MTLLSVNEVDAKPMKSRLYLRQYSSKHIHHKMCRHGGERIVTVWVLNDKGKKKTGIFFLVDGYEPETNTVYQFHGCHWHEHMFLKDRTKRQKKRYEDTR